MFGLKRWSGSSFLAKKQGIGKREIGLKSKNFRWWGSLEKTATLELLPAVAKNRRIEHLDTISDIEKGLCIICRNLRRLSMSHETEICEGVWGLLRLNDLKRGSSFLSLIFKERTSFVIWIREDFYDLIVDMASLRTCGQ